MKRVRLYTVAPTIPEPLRFLEVLAHNLWWCWSPDAIELFRRIDPELWKTCGRNPMLFLRRVKTDLLTLQTQDKAFLAHLERVRVRYAAEVGIESEAPGLAQARDRVAYFSLEYGLHESFRLYSGGLGVLAGDHLKAASDFGVPLVAVGLMYRLGFFRQFLSDDGWQQEHYPENEIHHLPLHPVLDAEGKRLRVSVPLPEGPLSAVVWRLDVGRVPLFLLDANTQDNPTHLRAITDQLYGGDRATRIRQEILLGVGGLRALLAMGLEPAVCHINEGHAAFLSLARLEHLTRKKGLDLETAMEIVPRTNIFTTHTPVPAGNEAFPVDLARPYLEALAVETGIPAATTVAWGQADDGSNSHELSMTILGLRCSRYSNGVSELHGHVARRMWRHLWPNLAEDESPIGHVTNGVHVPSWLSPDNVALFERYLGPEWQNHPSADEVMRRVRGIPDEELWRAHESGRSRLIRAARESLVQHYTARNASSTEVRQMRGVLDQNVLTIGFARRFATYKRGNLLLRDRERLRRLLLDPAQPIQLIFAGRAHPADNSGKELIREIVHLAREKDLRNRVVFLENYDINMARYLVHGVDVWLNTPRRPHEASGTSGMKAVINGGLHASVLDGWWCEGYAPGCGWAIGDGSEHEDTAYQDNLDAHALYNLLEEEIIPAFYDRGSGDTPRKWIEMMKASIVMGLSFFTSHRMVAEYRSRFYEPAAETYARLTADDCQWARQLVTQHGRLREHWERVSIEWPEVSRDLTALRIGDHFDVTTRVHLGALRPEEVDVQVYSGPVDSHNRIVETHVEHMDLAETGAEGVYTYRKTIACATSGRYGFTGRVTARGEEWRGVMPGFVCWATAPA